MKDGGIYLELFFILIYCVHACMFIFMHRHAMAYIQGSEDSFWESLLSLHHVALKDQAQVTRLVAARAFTHGAILPGPTFVFLMCMCANIHITCVS